MEKAPKPYLRSFGRVRGKKLRASPQHLADHFLPQIAVKIGENGALDLQADRAQYQHIAFEIGFGAGEHLLALARAKPDWLCVGAEPFVNAMVKLLRPVQEEKIKNIRLYQGDARDCLAAMAEGMLRDIYILFPDPWPKTRHHKRRLVQTAFLNELARVQEGGGQLLIATDHADYANWILSHMLACEAYEWQAQSKEDWENPPAIWQETKYQRKTTAQGRAPMFFTFVRKIRG